MNFWKKLFSVKKSPTAGIAEMKSPLSSATSDTTQQTHPQLHSIAAGEQSASFLKAVRTGDLEKVKMLLKDNPDLLFSKDNNGWSPLHMAVGHMAVGRGQREVVELLLANKADVNARDNGGSTPLHHAPLFFGDLLDPSDLKNRKSVVELLLANKADVNARNNEGSTPLHYAAAFGRRTFAELLLANKADVNATNNTGSTPLRRTREAATLVDSSEVARVPRQHGGHE